VHKARKELKIFTRNQLKYDEILGKVARIESTVNFFYDLFEFSIQNINIYELQEDLLKARKTIEFQSCFTNPDPKVSVIVPVSRPLSVIEKCLNSVLNQTFKNLELILICEYKNIELQNWVVNRNDKRIILEILNHEYFVTGNWSKWATSGARSRNRGLELATGDFFTFLDDDDFMIRNKIEMCVKIVQQNRIEFLAHNEKSTLAKGNKILRLNKILKTRRFHSGSIDYLGFGGNVYLLHRYFLKIKWPIFNYKNMRGNDIVYSRMIFASNPKFEFLPETLTIKS